MASPAQIDANRLNAQQSTGPRTDEGKVASSRNALKHGFNSKDFFVREDEQEEFAELREALEAEVGPSTAITWDLFTQLLHASWTMRRVRRMEADLLSGVTDTIWNEATRHQLELLSRYHARAERTWHRALKQLREYTTDLHIRESLPYETRHQSPNILSPIHLHRTVVQMNSAWEGRWELLEDPKPPKPKRDLTVWRDV